MSLARRLSIATDGHRGSVGGQVIVLGQLEVEEFNILEFQETSLTVEVQTDTRFDVQEINLVDMQSNTTLEISEPIR